MASQESYYASASIPSPRPQSLVSGESGAPPLPPPKSSLAEPGGSQTPIHMYNPPLITAPQQVSNASPRPQPPIPTSSSHPPSTSVPVHFTSFPQQQFQQVQPPSLEAHWLPDSLPPKTTADLAPILQHGELLTALAHSHPSYAASTAQLNSAIEANTDLARQLSALETQVQQSRAQSAQLLLQHTTLSTQWRRKQSEMDDALSPWGPRAMYQRLVSSISEQEAVIRAMQDSFLEGGEAAFHGSGPESGKASDKEVGDWIRSIREGTTTLEKRKETRARWDEGRVGGWR